MIEMVLGPRMAEVIEEAYKAGFRRACDLCVDDGFLLDAEESLESALRGVKAREESVFNKETWKNL